jgi:hypothetical protein
MADEREAMSNSELLACVARAISDAAYDEMRSQGFSGGWDHDALGARLAQAAIEAAQLDELRAENARALSFDEPDAFEAWWQTYKHKNRDLANYTIKKCIAFDAFHEALQQARKALGGTNG